MNANQPASTQREPLEQAMVDAFTEGQAWSFPDSPSKVPSAIGPRWGEDRSVRAEVVAELILTPPTPAPGKPQRLVIRNVRITGHLDIGCGRAGAFLFENCQFDESPNLNDCSASFVGFCGCQMLGLSASRLNCSGPIWLEHSAFSGPVILEDVHCLDLAAKGMSIKGGHDLSLSNARVTHDVDLARLQLQGSITAGGLHVGDSLILAYAVIDRLPNGRGGIFASLATFGGSIVMREISVKGIVNLEGASASGNLDLIRAKISNPNQRALDLDHASFDIGINAKGAVISGGCSLHHADIGCQLTFSGSTITDCPAGVAIRADHVAVDGTLFLRDGLTVAGTVDLHGAKIECNVELGDAKITVAGESAFALRMDQARVSGSLLSKGFTCNGALSIKAVQIGGDMVLDNATIEPHKGGRPAVSLNGSTVGGFFSAVGMQCQGLFTASDATIRSGMSIADAEVGASTDGRALNFQRLQLNGDLDAARLKANGCIDLSSCRVQGDVRFPDAKLSGSPSQAASRGTSSPATGAGWRGRAVRMSGAEIVGDLVFHSVRFDETLDMTATRIHRSLLLDNAVPPQKMVDTLNGPGMIVGELSMEFAKQPLGAINLRNAEIGTLSDSMRSWPTSGISIEGLQYARTGPLMNERERLTWLDQATRAYSPQPYEHLAGLYQALGQDKSARDVRLKALRRSHAAGNLGIRLWGLVQDGLIGYGYRPVRAALLALLIWGAGTIYFVNYAGRCSYAGSLHAGLCPTSVTSHPDWSPVVYVADLLLPILNLGHDGAWHSSGWPEVVSILLMVIGWVLVTTVVAAASRTLKRI